MENTQTVSKTKELTLCAVMAAVCCVLSVISIPIGAIPVSLGVLGIFLAAVILGAKRGAAAVTVFILIGAVGLPVFTGFRGGISVLAGLTGGYIWAYIPMAALTGAVSTRAKRNFAGMAAVFFSCIAGMIICYTLGTIQFILLSGKGLAAALSACVIPFIPFDIAKSLIAVSGGFAVRSALEKARIL